MSCSFLYCLYVFFIVFFFFFFSLFFFFFFFFFSSRRRHTRFDCDWSFRRVLFRSCYQRAGAEIPPPPARFIPTVKLLVLPLMLAAAVASAEPKPRTVTLDVKDAEARVVLRSMQKRSEERRVGKECRCRWGASDWHR